MGPDAGQRLTELWDHHGRLTFSDSVTKGDDLWRDVDPVVVDMEIAGVVSHVVSKSRLLQEQRESLESNLQDIDYVIANVPASARGYFEMRREMAFGAALSSPLSPIPLASSPDAEVPILAPRSVRLGSRPPQASGAISCSRWLAGFGSGQSEPMDDHQRRVWSRMIEYIEDYERGALGLGALCSSLEGLLGASDLRDQGLVEEFWNHFVEIDAEHELRTEAWAPVGAASDERLRQALAAYKAWVRDVLSTTDDSKT